MTDRLNPEALEAASDAVLEIYADGYCPKAEDAAEVAVSAYLAALPAPRTIATVEELGALPYESIILDADDDHLMLVADGEGGSYWVRFDDTDFYLTSDIALPAMVLWVPTEGGGE